MSDDIIEVSLKTAQPKARDLTTFTSPGTSKQEKGRKVTKDKIKQFPKKEPKDLAKVKDKPAEPTGEDVLDVADLDAIEGGEEIREWLDALAESDASAKKLNEALTAAYDRDEEYKKLRETYEKAQQAFMEKEQEIKKTVEEEEGATIEGTEAKMLQDFLALEKALEQTNVRFVYALNTILFRYKRIQHRGLKHDEAIDLLKRELESLQKKGVLDAAYNVNTTLESAKKRLHQMTMQLESGIGVMTPKEGGLIDTIADWGKKAWQYIKDTVTDIWNMLTGVEDDLATLESEAQEEVVEASLKKFTKE